MLRSLSEEAGELATKELPRQSRRCITRDCAENSVCVKLTSNKCIATSNKCLTSSNRCLTSSNKPGAGGVGRRGSSKR